jgi:hypothetical protein
MGHLCSKDKRHGTGPVICLITSGSPEVHSEMRIHVQIIKELLPGAVGTWREMGKVLGSGGIQL